MGLTQTKYLEDRITKYTESSDTQEILTTIKNIKKAFKYAKKDLSTLEIIIAIKNTGGYKIFTLLKGYIIDDKLDESYTESRELICIGKWNIKKALKITFLDSEPKANVISYTELHRHLFNTVEPTSLKYVIGVEYKPKQVSVDCNMLKGLTYSELKKVVTDSYKRVLRLDGERQDTPIDLSYIIVDFM